MKLGSRKAITSDDVLSEARRKTSPRHNVLMELVGSMVEQIRSELIAGNIATKLERLISDELDSAIANGDVKVNDLRRLKTSLMQNADWSKLLVKGLAKPMAEILDAAIVQVDIKHDDRLIDQVWPSWRRKLIQTINGFAPDTTASEIDAVVTDNEAKLKNRWKNGDAIETVAKDIYRLM